MQVVLRILKMDFGFFPALQNERCFGCEGADTSQFQPKVQNPLNINGRGLAFSRQGMAVLNLCGLSDWP
jgi:hypothetical protein